MSEFGVTSLPALVLFKKQRPLLFNGVHTAAAVEAFVKKQVEPALKPLKTAADVTDFFASRSDPKYSLSTLMVVGFFSDHEEVEEDDYEDFKAAAEEVSVRSYEAS